MRTVFSRSTLLLFLFATAARGGVPPVVFDFDALEQRDRARTISDYMTGLYGSQVDVDGAVAFEEEGDASDLFIATSFQLLNRGDFIISFLEVPIVGLQFEGRVLDGTFGDDFMFTALNGATEVLSFSRDDMTTPFDSGWIDFSEPVNQIIISDSGRKDVGIDDLVVQPVPEPAAGLLLLTGLAACCRARRWRSTARIRG